MFYLIFFFLSKQSQFTPTAVSKRFGVCIQPERKHCFYISAQLFIGGRYINSLNRLCIFFTLTTLVPVTFLVITVTQKLIEY